MKWANFSFLTFTLHLNYRFSSSLRTIVAVTFVLLEDYAIFFPLFFTTHFHCTLISERILSFCSHFHSLRHRLIRLRFQEVRLPIFFLAEMESKSKTTTKKKTEKLRPKSGIFYAYKLQSQDFVWPAVFFEQLGVFCVPNCKCNKKFCPIRKVEVVVVVVEVVWKL